MDRLLDRGRYRLRGGHRGLTIEGAHTRRAQCGTVEPCVDWPGPALWRLGGAAPRSGCRDQLSTAYLLEKSLSVDNLFLFILVFAQTGAIEDLRFLRTGLGIMLLFVAAKMLLADIVEIPPVVSLAIVVFTFGVAVIASRLFPGGK